MKVAENSYLRYSTEIKEADTGDIYLSDPEIPDIEAQIDDIEYIIEQQYSGRPDLIAHHFYGDSNLFWVIAERNNWENPFLNCKSGVSIFLPSKRYVHKILLR